MNQQCPACFGKGLIRSPFSDAFAGGTGGVFADFKLVEFDQFEARLVPNMMHPARPCPTCGGSGIVGRRGQT